MKKIITLIAFLLSVNLIISAPKPSSALNYIRQDFDVIKYDLKLDLLSYPKRIAVGVNEITFTMETYGDFYFHLKSLSVDSLFLNGSKTEYIYNEEDDYYSVFVFNPLDTNYLRIFYSGEMTSEDNSYKWGGVSSINNDLFSMGVAFGADYVSATRHFMPCYDHPSDKALFYSTYKVPKGIKVASNGLQISTTEFDDYDEIKWQQNVPSATYLMNFAASNYVEYKFNSEPETIVYGSKYEKNTIETIFPTVASMKVNFESYFRDYPFEKVGYVLTPIGSMEHASMISISSTVVGQYYAMKDVPYTVVAHELAHSWFGNSVTPLDFRDAWLSEGFATYCEALYHQYLLGGDAYISKIENDAKIYMNNIAKNEGILSLYDFDRTPPSSNYPATIYNKGATVLYMLSQKMGVENFYEAVNDYLNTFRNGNASTFDFQQIMQSHTQENLEFFFNQWVYGKGFPEIDIEFHLCEDYSGEGICASGAIFKQVQAAEYGVYTSLPIIIQYRGLNDEYFEIEAKISEATTEIEFDKPIEFKGISNVNSNEFFRVLAKVNIVNIPVSVKEYSPNNSLIFPNPAADVLNINLDNVKYDNYEIYNMLGEKFLTGNINSEENYLTVNLKSLPIGSYIIKLNNSDYSKMNMFIIER